MTARGDRFAFAHVVAIEGVAVRLNIRDSAHGRRSSAGGTASPTLRVGARFGIVTAGRVLVAEAQDLFFLDPIKVRTRELSSDTAPEAPLRQLRATILGRLEASEADGLHFVPGGLDTPALGDAAIPLDSTQLGAMLRHEGEGGFEVGVTADTHMPVTVKIDDLLARHIAVLGSSGQGKTSFVASLLQRLRQTYPGMRCVVFDVHGEYARALPTGSRVSRFGVAPGQPHYVDPVPFTVLGEDGLEALIDPSDKAQRPALRFALSKLPFVEWHAGGSGAGVAGGGAATLFSDCRQDSTAEAAHQCIQRLRTATQRSAKWPSMRALAALAAEFWSLQETKRWDGDKKKYFATVERDSFRYGHVAALVRRIEQLADDPEFTCIVNCDPGTAVPSSGDPFREHRRDWVESFFGIGSDPSIHVVDLRAVSHAYLPFILSGMMSALLRTIVERGQGAACPLLLVLEEAHQFARRGALHADNSRELLPYERLAKEGRKFGVSLLVSSQRPSEVSETVLAQCGTWFCLRLASEADRDRVRYASEWADRTLLQRIVALPKHEAIAFGSPFRVPVHLRLRKPDPWHDAEDAQFHKKWSLEGEQ